MKVIGIALPLYVKDHLPKTPIGDVIHELVSTSTEPLYVVCNHKCEDLKRLVVGYGGMYVKYPMRRKYKERIYKSIIRKVKGMVQDIVELHAFHDPKIERVGIADTVMDPYKETVMAALFFREAHPDAKLHCYMMVEGRLMRLTLEELVKASKWTADMLL